MNGKGMSDEMDIKTRVKISTLPDMHGGNPSSATEPDQVMEVKYGRLVKHKDRQKQ